MNHEPSPIGNQPTLNDIIESSLSAACSEAGVSVDETEWNTMARVLVAQIRRKMARGYTVHRDGTGASRRF